jgi:hypothetical protein
MLAKMWTVAVAAVVAGALALPAPAAYAQTAAAPAAKPMTMNMKKPMAHKASHHKMSCYDYAWDSQAMKDCLAKGTSKPMTKKSSKKKTTS